MLFLLWQLKWTFYLFIFNKCKSNPLVFKKLILTYFKYFTKYLSKMVLIIFQKKDFKIKLFLCLLLLYFLYSTFISFFWCLFLELMFLWKSIIYFQHNLQQNSVRFSNLRRHQQNSKNYLRLCYLNCYLKCQNINTSKTKFTTF